MTIDSEKVEEVVVWLEKLAASIEEENGVTTETGALVWLDRLDAEDAATLLREQQAEIERLTHATAIVRAYNMGYMAGHHDTVEGCFVHIVDADMDTYQYDVVYESLRAALSENDDG